ncbi:MAG: hypothetical protein M1129_05235 [Candidatus Thermoplasmatota archaeon]|nr:hypothetical protein [Candidatus Thermoplasmatota archaeon]
MLYEEKCRKHSFGSGAISNSCRHGTVTGFSSDHSEHGQDRLMLQDWEKDFSTNTEVLN